MMTLKDAMKTKRFWYDWIVLGFFASAGSVTNNGDRDISAVVSACIAGLWLFGMFLNYLSWDWR